MKSLQSFPRIPLAVLPTPIQKLENISRLLNTNVYIKRDDLTGIGLAATRFASWSSCWRTPSARARRWCSPPAAHSPTTPC